MKTLLVAIVVSAALLSACNGTSSLPNLFGPPSPSPSPAIPTPPPNPTPAPQSLPYGGQTIGTATFPDGDSGTGGQGSPVDGISCFSSLNQTFHVHVHLTMFHNGTQIALPKAIGVMNPTTGNGGFGPVVTSGSCFYSLHNHDASGIIHIENATSASWTLGNFFDIWGEPLSSSGFAGFNGPMLVYVGVSQFTGDPRTIPISGGTTPNREQITLEVGGPFVFPPFYTWTY